MNAPGEMEGGAHNTAFQGPPRRPQIHLRTIEIMELCSIMLALSNAVIEKKSEVWMKHVQKWAIINLNT